MHAVGHVLKPYVALLISLCTIRKPCHETRTADSRCVGLSGCLEPLSVVTVLGCRTAPACGLEGQ